MKPSTIPPRDRATVPAPKPSPELAAFLDAQARLNQALIEARNASRTLAQAHPSSAPLVAAAGLL